MKFGCILLCLWASIGIHQAMRFLLSFDRNISGYSSPTNPPRVTHCCQTLRIHEGRSDYPMSPQNPKVCLRPSRLPTRPVTPKGPVEMCYASTRSRVHVLPLCGIRELLYFLQFFVVLFAQAVCSVIYSKGYIILEIILALSCPDSILKKSVSINGLGSARLKKKISYLMRVYCVTRR
jgi:hypothetical protein